MEGAGTPCLLHMSAKHQGSWIRDHFHHFVVPTLKRLEGSSDPPDREDEQIVRMLVLHQPSVLTVQQHALIYDALRALKNRAKGKALIFPGRDTFPFFVAAQKQRAYRDRIHFFPWLSRTAATNLPLVRQRLEADGISRQYLYHHSYCFDTGFVGSIFSAIHRAYAEAAGREEEPRSGVTGGLVASESYSRTYSCVLQRNNQRTLVLQIEANLPKYFSTGNSLGEQQLKSKAEVLRTARLVYDLWYGPGKTQTAPYRHKQYCSICGGYHGLL